MPPVGCIPKFSSVGLNVRTAPYDCSFSWMTWPLSPGAEEKTVRVSLNAAIPAFAATGGPVTVTPVAAAPGAMVHGAAWVQDDETL